MRFLAFLLVTLTLVISFSSGAEAGDHAPMVVCHHDSGKMTMAMRHADGAHQNNAPAVPTGCCDGLACAVGALLPEPVSMPARAGTGGNSFAAIHPLLTGISVPPLLDPPRRSG